MSSTLDPSTPPPRPGADHADVAAGELDRALALVRFLRANCPWDAAQTAESLVPHLVEEAQEVVDAIHGAMPGELESELGDLLLNLAFQIVVAEESGQLTADSVTRQLEQKMRRRHPHLYGDGPKEDWEDIKRRERGRRQGSALLDGLAPSLDPLTRSHRVQQRVARVGFDWTDWRGAYAKVLEELDEVREELESPERAGLEEELGDLLFATVNLVRLAEAHPVAVLGRANHKFERRFRALEELARERGIELGSADLKQLDELWDEIKAAERRGQ
jgi:MazG family protein